LNIPITYSGTSVPGFRHWMIQMAIVYAVRKSIPKGCKVSIGTELEIKEQNNVYKIDVIVKYYKPGVPPKRVLYEVQNNVNVRSFREKMSILECDNAEIVPLKKAPDTIDEIETWIQDYIIIPNMRIKKRNGGII